MMKTFLRILGRFSLASTLFFPVLLLKPGVGAAGLLEGRLAECPNKANCVCSEQREDAKHYIEPIPLPPNSEFTGPALLKAIIDEMDGTVREESDNYLAATFTSAIFRFVDDLELRIDPTGGVIHLRSASRAGYFDFGVNRRRALLFKKLFDRKVSAVTSRNTTN